MNVADVTIKTFGFDDAQRRLKSTARFVASAPRMIGDLTAGVVRRSIKQLPRKRGGATRSNQWERSVEYEVQGRSVEVFYNLAVAKYARIRELGGEIRPFRAKFLFVPLRRDVRPNQPGLVFGRDFVLSKRVWHPGTNVMQYAIRRELLGDGGMINAEIKKRLQIAWDGKSEVAT